jgi:hypothetical protein
MSHLLHLVVRPVAFLLGAFFVLTAILLYPNEEGEIQSKFEDVWVRVDDFQNLALTRHAAFMTGLARLETKFLDRVFGYKLISVRAVGASLCCTLTAALAFCVYFFEADAKTNVILFGFPLLCIVGATYGRRLPTFVRVALWVAAFIPVTVFLLGYKGGIYVPERGTVELFIGIFVVAGFAGDVIFIAVTRRLFRWAGEMSSSSRVLVAVVLSSLMALVLVGPLIGLLFSYDDTTPDSLILAGGASSANIFDAVLALLFVLLALMLLIHRILWPLLLRTLFRVQAIGTAGRRAILMAIGLSLMGVSGWKVPELLKEILKTLGK